MAKLEDTFVLIRNGANIKQGEDGTGYPITRIETISDRVVNRLKMGYAGITDIEKYKDYVLQDGDILMSHINSEIHLGKSALYRKKSDEIIIHGMNLLCLRPNYEILDSSYVFYYFSSNAFLNQIPSITKKSVNQASFCVSALKKLSIPIPSFETQRQIAETLDKVTHLIDLYNRILDRFDLLVRARFVEMFGDLEAGTCIYQTRKLKELSTKISDGIHVKPDYTETGKPFLSVVNINKKKIDFTDCKYVSEEAYQKMIKSTHPEKGDVLYTKVGATYGIPAYVDTDDEFCLYVSVCLIKPKHDLINSKFLAMQMDMPFVKHQADRRIKGIGVPDLHLNQISEFDIICPPRHMQDNFITFTNLTDKSKSAVKQVLKNAETLKKALMQEYFG